MSIAATPEPPYYAVIFTSRRAAGDEAAYAATAARMMDLAAAQPGFLGVESAHEAVGITVSYWRDLDAIRAWRAHAEHAEAQANGRSRWYAGYALRIAKVDRAYMFEAEGLAR